MSVEDQFRSSILEALTNTMKVQCQYQTTSGQSLALDPRSSIPVDVVSTLELKSSAMSGFVALAFPKKVFLGCSNAMLKESRTNVHTDVTDCAAEIMNITFGSAKTMLTNKGVVVERVIPRVFTGKALELPAKSTAENTKRYPFTTSDGTFEVIVGLWKTK